MMVKCKVILFLIVIPFIISACNQSVKKEFWPDGTLKSEIHIRGDFYHGKATWWYQNGNKQLECTYENNLIEGLLTRWHENGIKQEEKNYRRNIPDGSFTTWNAVGDIQVT